MTAVAHVRRPLLAVGTDAKTVKGLDALGVLTGILYMAPADLSGFNVCSHCSPGCKYSCLNTAGRGAFGNVQAARLAKTLLFFQDRPAFLWNLEQDCAALVRKAERENLIPAVRPNGTSDLPYERIFPELFGAFPTVRFYDYTKVPGRTVGRNVFLPGFPSNYHLTFSRSEENDAACRTELERGVNVAVVFSTPKGQPLPSTCCGWEVIDGDLTDVRYLDKGKGPGPYVVGLRAKGKARKDTSGFVIHPETYMAWSETIREPDAVERKHFGDVEIREHSLVKGCT
jgi:hypothetical protein